MLVSTLHGVKSDDEVTIPRKTLDFYREALGVKLSGGKSVGAADLDASSVFAQLETPVSTPAEARSQLELIRKLIATFDQDDSGIDWSAARSKLASMSVCASIWPITCSAPANLIVPKN